VADTQNTMLISAGIAAALPLIPIGQFLYFGWAARKQEIVSRLSDQSIAYYKDTFYPESDFTNSEGFAKDYDARYGRQLFWWPVILFAAALMFLTYQSVSWVFANDWLSSTEGTAKIAISSLAGAYLWITFDLIFRARQNDINASDVNRSTLRLLVSLPLGFAVSAFAGVVPGTAVTLTTGALAFFVGAFPTDTVLKFMRRTAAVPLKLDADSSGDNVQKLTKIDGISVPIAERFIDEGVQTVVQLAYTDPVELTIKSGMDFSFILNCCGQALVAMYFKDSQLTIVQRKYGLRTGVEIKTLNDALLSYDDAVDAAKEAKKPAPDPTSDQAAAQVQLKLLAKDLQLDTVSTRFTLYQIAEDPYTTFQWNVWGPATSDQDAKAATAARASAQVAKETSEQAVKDATPAKQSE
jgi:hypothetical protein